MSASPVTADRDLCLVGHPFAPIGMGEHIRLTFRAMRSAGLRPGVADIYGLNERDVLQAEEFDPFIRADFGTVNIFHMNGDEVIQAMAHTVARQKEEAYNIIYPAWELSKYPKAWSDQLERFDEVWAPSRFIRDSIAASVSRPVHHMPLACEVLLSSFLGRRYFGIPEETYAFLFFFDLRSYASRKNPEAVIEAFRGLLALRPAARATLVVKVNGAVESPEAFERLKEAAGNLDERVLFVKRTMSDNEVKNLVRCCDCFVSLHRSEGFGRGMAEAMCLGKPVVATGYSGNMDFCDDETALLVPFRMIPLKTNEYPHAAGQEWADPDPGRAAELMARLVDDPVWGDELGRRASVRIRKGFGLRAAGDRFRRRLEMINDAIDARTKVPKERVVRNS